MRWFHSIRAAVAAAAVAVPIAVSAQQVLPAPSLQQAGATNFSIFLRGTQIGTEQIGVTRYAGGWLIVSAGRLGAPLDVIARRVEAHYTADWRPVAFTFDGSVRGQAQVVHT